MTNVYIKIKGTQGLNGEKSVVELSTLGTIEECGNGYLLKYEENEISENTKVFTTLSVKHGNHAVLERSGDMTSRFVITEGERNQCIYQIPEGHLSLGIYGKSVKYSLSPTGGMIKMQYTLDSNLQPISENTVEITVEARD